MLEVDRAAKRRGGRLLWQDLSFGVARGEVLAGRRSQRARVAEARAYASRPSQPCPA